MVEFTDDCIIGVEEIDNEHRHLFELIQRADDMLKNHYVMDRYEDIKQLIRELEDYADLHFAHEEAYMEKICDPELIRQRTQHLTFRDKIRSFSFVNIDEMEKQRMVLIDILNYLSKWLYHHIIGSDIMIGKLPPLDEWILRENPCEFVDEYRTGIPLIDAEHQELFRIVGKANDAVRSDLEEFKYGDVVELLNELKIYAMSHFEDEEEYMESIHYDGYPAQKRAHEAFTEKFSTFSEFDARENPQEYLEGIVEYLLGWLVNHILNADKKIPVR